MNMIHFNAMLAKPVNWDRVADSDFIRTQPKLDGIRCYITKYGAFSRNHKEFLSIDHIQEELAEIFIEMGDNIVLDGELYNHDFKDNFNEITSMVRREPKTQEDKDRAKDNLQFHCYDVYMSFAEDLDFIDRSEWISENLSGYEYTHVVPTHRVEADQESVLMTHAMYLEEGYEGTIVRLNEPYDQKRSNNLMKVKDFVDHEAEIIGFVEGKGKLENALGKFIAQDEDGIVFGMPPGKESHEERTMMWANREEYLGKLATFEHFGKTPGGKSYRHPMFKSIRDYE